MERKATIRVGKINLGQNRAILAANIPHDRLPRTEMAYMEDWPFKEELPLERRDAG